MINNAYQQAKLYAGKGFFPFPINMGTKIPALSFKELTSVTDEQLNLWFKQQSHNVALQMSRSGLVLIDVDLYKHPELQDFINNSQCTMMAQTPRGGYHLFYLSNGDEFVDTQGEIAPGIDVKSSGYAVVAPSIVNFDGEAKSYKWLTDLTPGPLPQHIRSKLRLRSKEMVIIPQKDDSLALLRNVIANGFTPNQHNSELRDLARLIARATNGSSEDFKRQFILTLTEALDAKDPTPQATSGNLLPTVQAAIEYENNRLGAKQQSKVSTPQVNLISLTDLITHSEPVSYHIQDWLPELSITMISAPPETYKTWLLMDIALSVALGQQALFLDTFEVLKDSAPVIFVNQEDLPARMASRFRTILGHKASKMHFNLITYSGGLSFSHPGSAPVYFHTDAELKFSKDETLSPSFAKLEERIIQTGAKWICLDPVYSLGSSEKFFADFGPQINLLKGIRARTGCGFLLSHHTKKQTNGSLERETIFGSQLMSGSLDWHIRAQRVKEQANTIVMTRSGKAMPDQKTITIHFDIDEANPPKFVTNVTDTELMALASDTTDEILLALSSLGEGTPKQISEYIKSSSEAAPSQATLYRTLTQLEKDGTLVKNKSKYAIKRDMNL